MLTDIFISSWKHVSPEENNYNWDGDQCLQGSWTGILNPEPRLAGGQARTLQNQKRRRYALGTADAKTAATRWFLSHVVRVSAMNERMGSFYKPQRLLPSSSVSCGEEGGNHCGHHHVFCPCRADPRWGRGPGNPKPLPVGPTAGKPPCCGGCRAGTIGGRRGQLQRSPPACRWSTYWQCNRCSSLWPLWEVLENNQNQGNFNGSARHQVQKFFIYNLQKIPEPLFYLYPTKHGTLLIGKYAPWFKNGCVYHALL